MRRQPLLEQPKYGFFKFWIKTRIISGNTPPHRLTRKKRGELAFERRVGYGVWLIKLQVNSHF